MRRLYDISTDLRALEEYLIESGGEITDDEAGEQIARLLQNLGDERDAKIDGILCLMREFQARGDAADEEATRLLELRDAETRSANRLNRVVKNFFETHGIDKLKLPHFNVSLQKNGGRVSMSVPEEWEQNPASAPEAYHRRIIQLDKEAIREALEEGLEINGCALGERGSHLRVR